MASPESVTVHQAYTTGCTRALKSRGGRHHSLRGPPGPRGPLWQPPPPLGQNLDPPLNSQLFTCFNNTDLPNYELRRNRLHRYFTAPRLHRGVITSVCRSPAYRDASSIVRQQNKLKQAETATEHAWQDLLRCKLLYKNQHARQ